jgi:acetylornithine deacetylase/succinyl-diaminopimelate desuccinylase-like protein
MNTPAILLASLVAAGLCIGSQASAQTTSLTPAQQQFREIYQQLVEINTTNSVGSCTRAVTAMAVRLKEGAFSESDMQIVVPPGAPQKGNLVARLKGSGASKPLLLLAHVDVVEARREDWERDPFKLIEENGMFYGRGSADDKAMAAIFVANMIRYKREHLAPKRDIILALTCDEEIGEKAEFNGVAYLLKHHRQLIDADLAVNEGGVGVLDKEGKPQIHRIQAGEKIFQSYELEVTNPGGHSAQPPRDNAIYRLTDGLSRLGKFDFAFRLSEVTRTYFERMSSIETGQVAADMRAILREPPDADAMARLYAANPFNNATVRTTCVATMLNAGHAQNALPQRAHGIVNCRILPGESVDEVRTTLARVMADDRIKITPIGEAVISPAPPLTPALMTAVQEVSTSMWPGVPLIPTMSSGGTDGRFLNRAGIPTYGISGLFLGPEGSGAHGLNERARVKSVYDGLEFLYRLGKRLGEG